MGVDARAVVFPNSMPGWAPWMEPTRFLIDVGYPRIGSPRTIDTDADVFFPFVGGLTAPPPPQQSATWLVDPSIVVACVTP
jgi:hypothetical protein